MVPDVPTVRCVSNTELSSDHKYPCSPIRHMETQRDMRVWSHQQRNSSTDVLRLTFCERAECGKIKALHITYSGKGRSKM